ncbi:hypothetical protein RFI_13865 [Reticulomyxa filosa]|uniref:Rab-GAP TBC domain-containing protein n=1 Tax=Reticulomyxa filosa TaxID=46433 RepID=X6NAJ3_RETFI|nr:hypothetical protein RFI_13865 [Reticulomyxa filosa]|eukprot:ETO23315.1 hypothetical protein RFI_13865 [Reticulomyxa filosa]
MKDLPVKKILDRYDNRRKYTHSHCSGGRISKSGQRGYGLRYMFTKSLPGCVIALLQFENLLQKHMPRLYEHLCVNDINIQSFVSEWFMTLFSYVLPLIVTFRVFDLFLVDGFKVYFFFFFFFFLTKIFLDLFACFLLLRRHYIELDWPSYHVQKVYHLMALEDDAILMYLKQFPDSGIFLNPDDEEDGDTFIEHALSFKMTNSELHLICTDLLAKTMAHNADNNSYAVFSKIHKR